MIDDDEAYGLHCDIGRLEQENARLRELMYDRAHEHAIQHMTEDELRITLANVLDENAKLRERVGNLFNAVIAKNNELFSLFCENEKLCNQLRKLEVEVDGTDEQEEAQGKPPM